MKTKTIRTLSLTLALAAIAFSTGSALAADGQDHGKKSATQAGKLAPADAKTIAAYPLDGCVVSGDKFDGGAMGKPKDYVYKTAGQPDRLVRLCCKDCVKDFNQEPAKFLKTLDDASAAKAKAGK